MKKKSDTAHARELCGGTKKAKRMGGRKGGGEGGLEGRQWWGYEEEDGRPGNLFLQKWDGNVKTEVDTVWRA